MTKWQWAAPGLIALMLVCTRAFSQNGDTYFAQHDYEKAMQAYIQSLQVENADGKRIIRYVPDTMTRIGISALQMNMTDGAMKVFKYVIDKTPGYAPAHFFLGVCYEKKDNWKLAAQIYEKYQGLSLTDPFREAMKGRLYYIREQQYIKDARLLVARGPGSSGPFSTQRLLVLDFSPGGMDSREIPVAKGLTSLIIDDFNRMGGFLAVPREKLLQVMTVMNWDSQALQDAKNIETLQRMLGVGTVVQGDLSISGKGSVKTSSRTITFTGVRSVKESSAEGYLSNMLVFEKKLVLAIVRDLNIRLSPSQINILKVPATHNSLAFLSYANAIHAMDMRQYDTAQMYLNKALEMDPQFALADHLAMSSEIFRAVQVSDLSLLSINMMETLRSQGIAGTGIGYEALAGVQPIDRLQEMGFQLDAGFIPGSDSRNNFEGVDLDALDGLFPDLDGEMPDPPDPPYTVDPWILPDPPDPPHRP